MRRCFAKLIGKSHSLTVDPQLILAKLRRTEGGGTSSGAVKCVDIGRNTRGEGVLLGFV
jgi:hypothetical protein